MRPKTFVEIARYSKLLWEENMGIKRFMRKDDVFLATNISHSLPPTSPKINHLKIHVSINDQKDHQQKRCIICRVYSFFMNAVFQILAASTPWPMVNNGTLEVGRSPANEGRWVSAVLQKISGKRSTPASRDRWRLMNDTLHGAFAVHQNASIRH